MAANLADLAPDGDRHPLRLQAPNVSGELRRQFDICCLLLDDRRLGDIHERRGIDVDIVETCSNGLSCQIPHRLDLRLGIRRISLRGKLEVVTLDENGPGPVLRDGGRQDIRRVLRRLLVGVTDLRSGDLEDECARIHALCDSKHSSRCIIGKHAQVHGGHGERVWNVAPAAGHVEIMDGAGHDAHCQGGRPDQVPRPAGLLTCAGGGYFDKFAHALPKRASVLDLNDATVQRDAAFRMLKDVAELGHQMLLVKM
jgi:hypothetical protein